MDIETIKKVYNRYTPIYNIAFNAIFQPGRKQAIDIINNYLPQPAKVLEVGVGTGLSLPFYRNHIEITGIDVATDMLSKARTLVQNKQLSNVKSLLEMDAQAMDFDNDYFDAVVAMYVVSVVPELDRFLNEVIRVCKPGGHIVIVNHFSSQSKLMRNVENLLGRFNKYIGFHPNFSATHILGNKHLKIVKQYKTNLFGYWSILDCVNLKNLSGC